MSRTLPNIRLKVALMKKGLTQRNLAFETQIDETRISKIIRGYEVPTWDMKKEIAKFLEMEVEGLF
ncbi:MAG: helix-turn-helix transcriptional regulator [Desulfobacteraceae bacterium]|nr:helix-turn-helix transcriptional regulator [Desulfobacteraceae bacterium]